MTTQRASIDDIEYVRRLAESGAHSPLLGGRFMLWWGFLLTIAYTAHHFALNGQLGDHSTIFAWIWLPFPVVGIVGQWLLARSMPAKSGAGSAGNRASRSVWIAGACTLASMVVGSAIAAETGAPPATFDWVAPVGFAVYACALIVTGSLSNNRTIVAAGAGAVIMVGLFTAMILHPDRYLLAAAGTALTVFLPGLLLLMAEPRARG
jgi:hypothetical protein